MPPAPFLLAPPQALGYDHFAVVGSEEGDCSLFEETWCSTQFGGPGPVPDAPDNATAAAAVMCRQAYPGCAWISATESEDGQYEWQHMQQRPVERLWLFRYIFAYECIQRGVNILISDLDVVLHGGARSQLLKITNAPASILLLLSLTWLLKCDTDASQAS